MGFISILSGVEIWLAISLNSLLFGGAFGAIVKQNNMQICHKDIE